MIEERKKCNFFIGCWTNITFCILSKVWKYSAHNESTLLAACSATLSVLKCVFPATRMFHQCLWKGERKIVKQNKTKRTLSCFRKSMPYFQKEDSSSLKESQMPGHKVNISRGRAKTYCQLLENRGKDVQGETFEVRVKIYPGLALRLRREVPVV